MCRANCSPAAEPSLARLLDEMAHALAELTGTTREQIHIGPVDFGQTRNRG